MIPIGNRIKAANAAIELSTGGAGTGIVEFEGACVGPVGIEELGTLDVGNRVGVDEVGTIVGADEEGTWVGLDSVGSAVGWDVGRLEGWKLGCPEG